MSMPSNPKPQTESDQHEVDFLKSELALCFTFGVLAARKYEAGNRPSAERSIGHAEEPYAAVLPLVSDRKHSKYLNDEAIQDFTAELQRLRERLDGLTTKLNKNIDSPAEMKRSQ